MDRFVKQLDCVIAFSLKDGPKSFASWRVSRAEVRKMFSSLSICFRMYFIGFIT